MNHPRNVMDFVRPEVASRLESGFPDSLDPTMLSHLLMRGYLTNLTPEQEDEWISGRVDELESAAGPDTAPRNYCFITTYRCNFACSYCFQSNTDMRTVTSRMLSLDEANAGLSIMKAHLASGLPGCTVRRPVLLFGGEPLLPNRRDVIETIVLGCEDMGFTVETTTNGFFLELFEDLLGPKRVASLQISLDGPPEIHDRRRVPQSGKPTFDRIWSNVKTALDRGCTVNLRCNIDRRNLSAFVELAEFVDQEGLLGHPRLHLRYARVVPDFESVDGAADIALGADEIERHLIDAMATHPALARIPLPSDIQDFQTWITRRFPTKVTRHCGAVQANIYFGPDREIYPCHETVGRTELSIGRYHDGKIVYNDSKDKWRNRRPDKLTLCKRCPYVLTCAGGCAAHVDLDGEPLRSNCENFDQKFSLAVKRAYLGDRQLQAHAFENPSC